MTLPLPGFTGSPLDRQEPVRTDPQAFAAMSHGDAAVMLVLDGYTPAIAGGKLCWARAEPLPPLDQLALLGTIDGVPRLVRLDPHATGARRTGALMDLLAQLDPGEAETYAVARSLADWHARHRFCANCGGPSAPVRAGWARHCAACGTDHFPRTDPVVIMLAEHRFDDGTRVLVGRQPAFPPGRFSALAGFVEVGESIEEAVARELFEEAGVVARDVRYLASQPWPFPSQLMIACVAQVDDPAIRLDQAELEDARWVTRDEVRAALDGADEATFDAPPPHAIANTLMRRWVGEDG